MRRPLPEPTDRPEPGPDRLPAVVDELLPARVTDPSQHPVAIYLARLAPGSRRAQATAWEIMAKTLTSDRLGPRSCPGTNSGTSHTQALRAALAAR